MCHVQILPNQLERWWTACQHYILPSCFVWHSLSTNITNFILLWSSDCANVSTIHSSNCTLEMWLKSGILSNFTWNLFKLTIEWLYNISRKCNQGFENFSKFSTYYFSIMLKSRLNITIGVPMCTSPNKHA